MRVLRYVPLPVCFKSETKGSLVRDLAASFATDIGVPGARGMSMVGVFKFFDAVIIISRRRGMPIQCNSK